MDQIDLGFWGFDPGFRFLLEGVKHPDIHIDLHGIDDPVGLAPVPQGQLQNTRSRTLERLGDVWIAAFGDDTQRAADLDLSLNRERLEILSRALEP